MRVPKFTVQMGQSVARVQGKLRYSFILQNRDIARTQAT